MNKKQQRFCSQSDNPSQQQFAWDFNTDTTKAGTEVEETKSAASLPASSLTDASLTCPNCGTPLEGRKCKLFCPRPGCGYLVTCSEW